MRTQKKKIEFHGYVGHIARLKSGDNVRILGGHNMKLFVRTLDGDIKECYHDDLQLIWED